VEGQNIRHITIVAYGTTIVGLPSQIAYGSWQKIRHVILPWRHHLTTLLQTEFHQDYLPHLFTCK